MQNWSKTDEQQQGKTLQWSEDDAPHHQEKNGDAEDDWHQEIGLVRTFQWRFAEAKYEPACDSKEEEQWGGDTYIRLLI